MIWRDLMDIVREKIIANRPIIIKHYDKLVDSEYLTSTDPFNHQRLLDQIRYMRASSDFYKRLLNERPTEQWVKEFGTKYPFMDKRTLMEHFNSICTTDDIRFEEVEKYLQNKDLVDAPYSNPNYIGGQYGRHKRPIGLLRLFTGGTIFSPCFILSISPSCCK
jgi:hypothetical protein